MLVYITISIGLVLTVLSILVELQFNHKPTTPPIVRTFNESQFLRAELAEANKQIVLLKQQLEKYQATQATLESLGASELEARRAMIASTIYGIDPKSMAH